MTALEKQPCSSVFEVLFIQRPQYSAWMHTPDWMLGKSEIDCTLMVQ